MADLTFTVTISASYMGLPIQEKVFKVSTPVTPGSGLVNAQAADTALKAEIATYITDVATAIQNAIAQGGDSDAAVQQIATDMLTDAQTLSSSDPVTNPTTTTPTTPTSQAAGTAGEVRK